MPRRVEPCGSGGALTVHDDVATFTITNMAARTSVREPSARAVLPAWLEPRLSIPSLRILDVRADIAERAVYREGHLPGAIALDVRAQLFDHAGDVVSAPELAMVMSGLGVGDGDTIVLVDDGWPDRALAAARALAKYGHHDVHVLDGGFTRWIAEGRPTTKSVAKRAPASFTARVPS